MNSLRTASHVLRTALQKGISFPPNRKKQKQATRLVALGMLAFTAVILSGCATPYYFRDLVKTSMPYEWEKVIELPGKPRFFFDLDHDGYEESLEVLNMPHADGIFRARLYSEDLELADQINFNGPIRNVFPIDWNRDGHDDLVFFYSYQDTAFVRIVDKKLHLLQEAPLFSGKPTTRNGVFYRWTGQVFKAFLTDLEGDGRDELVVIASEGYAKAPRGVFVYSVPSLRLKWKYEMGPPPGDYPVVADFDGDGKKEIMIPTYSTCNGNRANGTDDNHSYLFVLNYDGSLRWRREFGGKYSRVKAYYCDFDGNHRMEIVVFVQHTLASQIRPGIQVLDPVTGRALIPERKLSFTIAALYLGQLDSDLPLEILLADRKGTLMLFDEKLNVVRKNTLPYAVQKIYSVQDLNGDGINDIFCLTANQFIWLDVKHLTPLALLPAPGESFNPQQRRLAVYHSRNWGNLLVACDNQGQPVLYRAKKRLLYPVQNWAVPFLAMVFLVLMLYSGHRLAASHWEKRFLQQTLEKCLAATNRPAFILDANDHIMTANSLGKMMLHLPEGRFPVSLQKIEQKNPKLAEELRRLRFSDSVRQRFSFLDRKNAGVVTEMVAEPLEHPGYVRPFWFVYLQEKAPHPEFTEAADWAALASKVAHDVKTPLTSIQLTLQRLQKEWQNNPTADGKIPALFTKVFERIGTLRKAMNNFTKLMNLEELVLVPVDLNRFVEQFFSNGTLELAEDIQLNLQLQPGLPPVPADREQLQTVLENLVTNAVNAMPEGGILTVRTELARYVRFENDPTSRNYVLLEILDTGKGIPEGIQPMLFKPFVKDKNGEVGLGLTIVKKIVRDHGGRIELHSVVDTGTAVTVYFPTDIGAEFQLRNFPDARQKSEPAAR